MFRSRFGPERIKKKRATKNGRLPTPTAAALHITECPARRLQGHHPPQYPRDRVYLHGEGQLRPGGERHSANVEYSAVQTNGWTGVQNFMVTNRPAQRLHLMKLVGFFAGNVPADMNRDKIEEREEEEMILTEFARADEQPAPPTDELLLVANCSSISVSPPSAVINALVEPVN